MATPTKLNEFDSSAHDHGACVAQALARAEEICRQKGERLTELRSQVLSLVWSDHKPIKAYDLLTELAAMRAGVAPTTVYRALDFLQAQGLVHKIESLNAYFGCVRPEREHDGQFLICDSCERVMEVEDKSVSNRLRRSARDVEFQVSKETVELTGTCRRCRESAD